MKCFVSCKVDCRSISRFNSYQERSACFEVLSSRLASFGEVWEETNSIAMSVMMTESKNSHITHNDDEDSDLPRPASSNVVSGVKAT